MKKILMTAVLASALLPLATTSCGNDDDLGYSALTLETEFDLDYDSDLLKVADIQVTYTDFSGSVRTLTLTGEGWQHVMSSTAFPCYSNYAVAVVPKETMAYTQTYYNLEFEVEYEATAHLGKKKYRAVPEYRTTLCSNSKVAAADVSSVLADISRKAAGLDYNYTFDGTSLSDFTAILGN